ncbi:peroxisomal biogenesis factor 2 [Trematosphaeria pertusa]|uniref:Peroxisomal biogenesis factor 2 n=1 Tax=Trematosphaeria pertusa TaxID=390896 RepID=A0A6A6IC10_9PLEO|nr:peroxisomal biogenesis factor 2 [Trematosphaeria pertusa]KAF2247747.1 peroxisomal biogenesis factor 2 [Trematosphaeria pertusa]
MPSADFAAAQERIAARRAQRARANHDASTSARSSASSVSRLPFPFNTLGTTGLSAWNAIRGREGTRPEFRVGQVDAELLDEELLELLKGQVSEGLKYFGSHITDTYTPEILLGLRLVLFKLSIWNNNASYGAHLQGLRYTDARSSAPDRPLPKKWQKAAYGLITVGGRYAWTKWEEYLLSTSEDYTRPQSETLRLASRITEYINSAHDVASLASFLVFLVNGRYRTLTDRLLRLRLAPTSHSASREVSFEYLNRQLVWHAFTEFLLFLLPLVGISRWRRILSRTWRKLRTSILSLLGRAPSSTDEDDDSKTAGELGFLPERTCAICYRDQNPTTATEQDIISQSAGGGGVVGSAATDITNPYEAVPCGCIYCFACLAQRIANEEGEGWTCLRCGELVKECRPWNGDVIEERRTSHSQASHAAGNGKSVGFATTQGEDDHEQHVRAQKEALREVEPIPEQDITGSTASEEGRMGLESTRGLDLGESLDESAEWARASEDRSSDEQSEEYDEDEEEEGEELDYEGN